MGVFVLFFISCCGGGEFPAQQLPVGFVEGCVLVSAFVLGCRVVVGAATSRFSSSRLVIVKHLI